MRSPVLEGLDGCYFLPSAGPASPSSIRSREELLELEEGGLVTLIEQRRRYRQIPGGVLLYVHPTFVRSGNDLFDVSIGEHLRDIDFDERLKLHITYTSRDEALIRLHGMGQDLLADAKSHLCLGCSSADQERAFDSARRARITAPPPEHPNIRRDAFVLMAVAWQFLGKDIEDIFRAARLDRNPTLLANVKTEAPARIEAIRRVTACPPEALR